MTVLERLKPRVVCLPNAALGSVYKGTPAANTPTTVATPYARPGDVVVAIAAVRAGAASTLTAAAGYTRLLDTAHTSSMRFGLWVRVLDGTAADALTIQNSAATAPTIYTSAVFADVDRTTPVDVNVTPRTGATGQTFPNPGLVEAVYATSTSTTNAVMVGGDTVTATNDCILYGAAMDVGAAATDVFPVGTRLWTNPIDDDSDLVNVLDTTQGTLAAGVGLSQFLERRPLAGPVNQHSAAWGDGSHGGTIIGGLVALRPRSA